MSEIVYREARPSDIAGMAAIRAADWGDEQYWTERIQQYMTGVLPPRDALGVRAAFVCTEGERVIGLVAGHLTRRFGCDGELQWMSVTQDFRRRGVASHLLRLIGEWFIAHHAKRICVDVDPVNRAARQFYGRHGAENLRPHWMIWKDISRIMDLPQNR